MRVGDTRAAIEPDRAVPVPDHDSDLRMRIDRHSKFGVERETSERAVAEAGLWLIFEKAAVADGEPRKPPPTRK